MRKCFSMSFYVTHPYIARAYVARAYVLPTLVSFPDLCLPGPKNPSLCFPALFCPDHCVCTSGTSLVLEYWSGAL